LTIEWPENGVVRQLLQEMNNMQYLEMIIEENFFNALLVLHPEVIGERLSSEPIGSPRNNPVKTSLS